MLSRSQRKPQSRTVCGRDEVVGNPELFCSDTGLAAGVGLRCTRTNGNLRGREEEREVRREKRRWERGKRRSRDIWNVGKPNGRLGKWRSGSPVEAQPPPPPSLLLLANGKEVFTCMS